MTTITREELNDFQALKSNGFVMMKQLKDQGKKVVGVFCAYTPNELVMAADAVPVGLCGSSENGIPEAEQVLPRNLCPLIKSSYGLASADKCPYFYFSDMVLAETTCDGKKKMYEKMGELKPTHIMQLPAGRTGAKVLEAWEGEMYRAKEAIEKHLGATITQEKLREAIRLKNRERRAVLDYFEIGKLNPCPISGYELNNWIQGTPFIFDIEERIERLEERVAELKELYQREYQGKPSRKPRILITGCPTGGVNEKVIKTIEDCGGSVVCFENCSGPREKRDPVDETMEPMRALAEKYLRINCSVMSPNPGRFEAMSEMIRDYQIDGVVEVILHACHTFAIEADNVKRHVTQQHHLPYLCVETDFSQADVGQLRTRLSAFLEMIG